MGKSHKAKASSKIAKVAKTTGVELNETQLDQAAGGIIVVCRKPG
jgi:hypothetical protein